MDSEAQALESALAALRQQFNGRLAGSIDGTQGRLRATLVQQLGVDDVQADRLVKRLVETGRLRYIGGTQDGDDTDILDRGAGAGATGAATVQRGEGFIAPPATVGMAAAPDAAGLPGAGRAVAPIAINTVATSNPDRPVEGAIPTGIGTRETARDDTGTTTARGIAENREQATMGQMADTNVTGPSTPLEAAEASGPDDDDSTGYWQIG